MTFSEIDKSLKYKVADLSQATWGRKEMQLAENEMPGRWPFEKNTVGKSLCGVLK